MRISGINKYQAVAVAAPRLRTFTKAAALNSNAKECLSAVAVTISDEARELFNRRIAEFERNGDKNE